MSIEFFDLGQIAPNPFQSRRTIDEAGIAELAVNILEMRHIAPELLGLLHAPRGRRHGDGVQLAYGHRRLAAFQHLANQGHLDYATLPVELMDLADTDMAILVWSENLARADVNLVDQARFLRHIIDEFGWSLDEASKRLGMAFSTLSCTIRVINLPVPVQDLIVTGALSRERCMDLAGMLGRVKDETICHLADEATKQNYRQWRGTVRSVHAETPAGISLHEKVLIPAVQVLVDALSAGEPGAYRVVASAIDKKLDIHNAEDLAKVVIDRLVGRSRSISAGKRRVVALYEEAGLDTPWNAAAMSKTAEFLAWKQKKQRSRRAA